MQPTLKGKSIPRIQSQPSVSNLDMGTAISVGQLIYELKQLKQELINTLNKKLQEVDDKIKDHTDTATMLKDTQNQVIDYVGNILKGDPGDPGNPGKEVDEISLEKKILSKVPKPIDIESLTKQILSKVPRTDEKALTNRIIQALPKNKASLKIIQESFDVDPMSVIEKIMSLPEGKFKLTTKHIDGLEQTMAAFRSQLGRGYLHGGGDTVTAGTNITITTTPGGKKQIASTGGGSLTPIAITGTVNGSNKVFTSTLPTYVISDGVWNKAVDRVGATNWTWVAGTLTLVSMAPPTSDIYGF
jgi:predicted transcriptional regulator